MLPRAVLSHSQLVSATVEGSSVGRDCGRHRALRAAIFLRRGGLSAKDFHRTAGEDGAALCATYRAAELGAERGQGVKEEGVLVFDLATDQVGQATVGKGDMGTAFEHDDLAVLAEASKARRRRRHLLRSRFAFDPESSFPLRGAG